MTAEQDLLTLYEEGLRRYLLDAGGNPDEDALQACYALGRQLIAGEGGLIDLAALHSEALARVLPEVEQRLRCADATRQAASYFVEGLSPFEMALRGFREANATLQAVNQTLEQRVAERTREAQESRWRYQHLVDHVPALVYAVRVSEPLEMEFVGPQVQRLLGVPPAAWTVEAWLAHVHPEDREGLERRLRHVEEEAGFDVEYRLQAEDGRTVWVRDTARVVAGLRPGELYLHGLAVDVTHHRSLEEQLRQAQKMEAIGRLAGGVAHDFNNILSVIVSYATFALESLQAGEPVEADDLRQVIESAERAAGLTRQLLSFSRHRMTTPQVVDPNVLMRDLEKMLRRILREDVQLVTHAAPGEPWLVRIDPSRFEQVLLNLTVNARDAMPQGGQLTITIENATFSAQEAASLGLHAGEYVEVRVQDNGVGIPPQLLDRIFEPFFTTKGEGRGTGLGLATCYAVVVEAGGHIRAESTPPGSTFRVWLPRHAGSAPCTSGAELTQTDAGQEVILVVEDDLAVRNIAVRTLGRRGYTVLHTADGAEALDILAHYQGEIHLLLSDVVMPGMGGVELAAKAAELRPQLKILLMSGYSDLPEPDPAEDGTQPQLLQKPFTPEALARRVRETLDG